MRARERLNVAGKRSQKLSKEALRIKIDAALANGDVLISDHARRRKATRRFTDDDIFHALRLGHPVARRDKYEEPDDMLGWSYCIEGKAIDATNIRTAIAFHGVLVVITIIDLDHDDE